MRGYLTGIKRRSSHVIRECV
ncbi:hypothetical protein [Mesotoga sp. B105.6.4]